MIKDNLKKETANSTNTVLAEGLNSEQKAMIEDVTVFSLLQKYDDGRPDRVWSIGDITKDGKITSFAKGTGDYWYALTKTHIFKNSTIVNNFIWWCRNFIVSLSYNYKKNILCDNK